ncbi:hypothetical protein AAG906_003709 [Vitis piasezkii]
MVSLSIGPKEGESSWKLFTRCQKDFSLEKVHKRSQRADCIPLLFPRLLCQILEHLGYPAEPQLERKRICREPFTLDKWNNMTAYKVDQLSPRQGEHLQDIYRGYNSCHSRHS